MKSFDRRRNSYAKHNPLPLTWENIFKQGRVKPRCHLHLPAPFLSRLSQALNAFSPNSALLLLGSLVKKKKKSKLSALYSNGCKSCSWKKSLNHPSSLASYELWANPFARSSDKPLNLWALAMQSMREWVSVWTFSCLPTPGTHGKQGLDPTSI